MYFFFLLYKKRNPFEQESKYTAGLGLVWFTPCLKVPDISPYPFASIEFLVKERGNRKARWASERGKMTAEPMSPEERETMNICLGDPFSSASSK